MTFALSITVFVLAAFVGFSIISRIPNQLHTPLMSVTNALHGLALLGAMVAIGDVADGVSLFLAMVAIAFATLNIVGGFLVSDRMLAMFQVRRQPPAAATGKPSEDGNVIKVD